MGAVMVESDQVAARLGAAVRLAREGVGVTQAELGRRLGIASQEMNRYERGGSRLSLERIVDVERVLGVRAGTVLRLAGFVDDNGLVDVDTLAPWAQTSIGILLERAKSREVPGGDQPHAPESPK